MIKVVKKAMKKPILILLIFLFQFTLTSYKFLDSQKNSIYSYDYSQNNENFKTNSSDNSNSLDYSLSLPENSFVDKTVTSVDGELNINGVIPVAVNFSDEKLQQKINLAIDEKYINAVQSAKSTNAMALDFSYNLKTSKDINTVLINTTMTVASGKSDVSTINYSLENSDILTLEDLLGANYLKISNEFIQKNLQNYDNQYNGKFSSISENQNFYVENNNLVFLFGEYEITSGANGIVSFDFNLDDLKNYQLNKANIENSEYGLPMVPLRTLCENFGYTVDWNNEKKEASVNTENLTYSVKLGSSNYLNNKGEIIALEASPILQDDILYVPTTFFDKILNLIYLVSDNGDIIYSSY